MHSTLDPSSVFCPPLPGKPNTKQAYDSSSGQIRGRIVQSAQKGETCGYYALQILRNEKKIGKHPLPSQIKERGIEQIISAHRKAVTHIYNTLYFRIIFSEKLSDSLSKACTIDKAREILSTFSQHTLEPKEQCLAALQAFCSQNKYVDFPTFAKNTYEQALIDAHKQYFRVMNISLEIVQNTYPKLSNKNWKETSLIEKRSHMQALVFTDSYRKYGCKRSSWHPDQPIQKLIEQLHLHGPHLIVGKFGRLYYEDSPTELNMKLKNRSILGWRPPYNKRKNEQEVAFHCIVVVGAKTYQDKEQVYFIDPIDGSDPSDITTQKIYAMAYTRVRSSIASLTGGQMKPDQGQNIFEIETEENNYALYA